MFTTEFSMLLTVFEMFCLDEAEVETVLLFVVEVSLFLLFIFEKEKLPFIALLIPDITELDAFSPTPKK